MKRIHVIRRLRLPSEPQPEPAYRQFTDWLIYPLVLGIVWFLFTVAQSQFAP